MSPASASARAFTLQAVSKAASAAARKVSLARCWRVGALCAALALVAASAQAQSTYTWNAVAPAAWTLASNWTPARTSPASDDVLVFDGALTPNVNANGIPTESMGQLRLQNGASVALLAPSPGPVTLTLTGGTGTDLDVPTGTALFMTAIGGSTQFDLQLGAGATGLVTGALHLVGGISRALAVGTNALVFGSGGLAELAGGASFGSTNLNSILFQSGSTLTSQSPAPGLDLFGAAVPNSVLTLAAGSLYDFRGNQLLGLSGRTFANLEINSPGLSATAATGSQACFIDNLTVTAGTPHIRLTNVHIRGDVAIASGGLIFDPTLPQTIALDGGAPQSLSGPSCQFNANSTVAVSNAAGVTIQTNTPVNLANLTLNGGDVLLIGTATPLLAISGQLSLTNGVITTGVTSIRLTATATVSGGSSVSYVNGNLRRAVSASAGPSQQIFAVGDATTFAPVTLAFPSVTTSGDLTVSTAAGDHASIGASGLDAARSVNRTWSISNNGAVFAPCAAIFSFVPADLDPGTSTALLKVLKFSPPSTWASMATGARTATSTEATGIVSFDTPASDFALADPVVVVLPTITATAGSGAFGVRTDFATGAEPNWVALGDVNGDGRPDVASANRGFNTVSVRLGDGVGGFGARADFATGTDPFSVVIGDVSGDGRPDLVVADLAVSKVSVLLGDGAGGFGAKTDFTTGAFPSSVVIGEVNGDDRADLVTTNFNAGTVSVLLGDGAGGFGPKTDFPTGVNPYSVAIRDLNSDTSADLVVTNNLSGTVSVLLGDGAGSFGAKTDFATGVGPYAVALGDLNGDGQADAAVTNSGAGTVSVLLGNGAGGFGLKTDFATGAFPLSVVIRDVNGDGRPDLAVANYNSSTVSVLLGAGAGSFAAKTDFVTGSQPTSLAIDDLSADGTPDLVVANQFGSSLSVLLGLGGSIAPPGVTTLSPGANQTYTITPSTGYAILDVRVDGVSQGAIGSYPFSNVSANHTIDAAFFVPLTITATAGSGAFGPRTDFATGATPNSLALGDVNGDGRLDMAVANRAGNSVSMLLGDGAGGFGAKTDYATGTDAFSVAIGDVSGDGRPDLVVADLAVSTVSVLLGDGAGGFGAKTDFATGDFPSFVAIGEVNGDDRADLVTTNYNAGGISVLLGDGLGGFAAKTDFTTGLNPYSVAIQDVNGDGGADLAVANLGSGTVSVLLGTGAGGFGPKTDFTAGVNPYSVALGDMNGDGQADMAVANLGSATVSVLLGNGAGGFGAKTDFATGASPLSVVIRDVNGDGPPDLAVANFGSSTVSVLLGNGTGSFAAKTDFATGLNPALLALGDVNGDGTSDVVAVNQGSSTASVLLGLGGSIAPPGTTSLNPGANQTYTIIPSAGYGILDVRVDGVSQGAIGSYPFSSVSANHTIAAAFTAAGGTATLAGVVNTGLGSAQLHVTAAGVLVVSNIGSSGNDGVSFPASAPDEGRGIEFAGGLPIDPATDVGGSVTVQMLGSAAGQAASLGTIRADVVATGMDITPDFAAVGATDVHVEAFLNGQRVHSCRVPNGTVLHRGTSAGAAFSNGRSGGPLSPQTAGDGISGVEVGLKKKPGGQLSVITFTTGRTVTVNGTSVVANKLRFTVAASKQPITAATAVLKIAGPSGAVASSRTGEALIASNLSQVQISAQPAIADNSGGAAGGIRVEPAGGASFIGGSMQDGPTVAGIGSSGNDGVECVMNSTTGATHSFGAGMGFNTATDVGAFLEHRVRGKVDCAPDSTVAIGTESVHADSISLRADFSRVGATGVTITLMNNGLAVHEAAYGTGQSVRLVQVLPGPGLSAQAASINTTRSNIKDKASIAGRGVTVSWAYKRPGGATAPSRASASATQAMPFDMLIGSSRYQADEVHFAAVGGTQVTEITGASMLQKNPGGAKLDTLRLGRAGLSAGDAAVSNVSKGAASLLASNGKIIVHDIGSSGLDGVEVKPERPSTATTVRVSGAGDASTWPGAASMRFATQGSRAGAGAAKLLEVSAEKSGSSLRLGPKPSAPAPAELGQTRAQAESYRLEVLMNDVVVATLDAAAPEVDFDRLPDQVSGTASGSAFLGRWDATLLLSVVGGPSQLANGVRIRPLGLPDDVESISSMEITAAGIASFEVGGWLAPVLGVTSPPHANRGVQLTLGRNPISRGDALELTTDVPSPTWVDLDVFDAQGRRTASLYHGMQVPGIVRRGWTPAPGVMSGLYFVRLRAAGTARSHKVIYME